MDLIRTEGSATYIKGFCQINFALTYRLQIYRISELHVVSDFNSDDSEQQQLQQQQKPFVQQDGPQYGMLTRYLESLNARTNR